MAKEIIIGVVGLLGVYVFYKLLTTSPQKVKPTQDVHNDILNNEEYKVKGQWEK